MVRICFPWVLVAAREKSLLGGTVGLVCPTGTLHEVKMIPLILKSSYTSVNSISTKLVNTMNGYSLQVTNIL